MELERRFYGEAALRIEHHIHRCLHTGGHIDRDVLAAAALSAGQADMQRLRLIFCCNFICIRPEISRFGHIPRDGRLVDIEMVPRSGRQLVDDQLLARIHDIPSFRNVRSADAALHLQTNEIVHFHRVLQRQLLGDVVRKAADDQRAGVLLAHAAAHEIKHRLVADAADLGLMADSGVLRADVHGRDGIGAGLGVKHQ